jgi:hypothetical protein
MYDIGVSAPGLNTAITVEVKPGTTTVVPIELSMAMVASTMTVTASDPPLTLLVAQALVINRLAGLPYPFWTGTASAKPADDHLE